MSPASGGTGKGSLKIENTNPTRNPPIRVESNIDRFINLVV